MGLLEGEGPNWWAVVLAIIVCVFIFGGFALYITSTVTQDVYCDDLGFDGRRVRDGPSYCYKVTDDGGGIEKMYYRTDGFGFPVE